MTQPRASQAQAPDVLKDLIDLASREAIQRAEERAALPPERPARFTRERLCLAGLVISAPVLVLVLATNVLGYSFVDMITPAPTPEMARQEAQRALDIVVRGVESFREDYAELPDRLVEVGIPDRGQWTYLKKSGGQYQVVGDMYGQVVRFDSPAPQLVPDGRRP